MGFTAKTNSGIAFAVVVRTLCIDLYHTRHLIALSTHRVTQFTHLVHVPAQVWRVASETGVNRLAVCIH